MADMRQRMEAYSIPTQPQMPVGVGFVTGSSSIGHFKDTALSLISKHTPAAVWLFAPDQEVNPHPSIISALKTLDPRPQVVVQVGNVQAARDAVSHGADILVCQGLDAGGHQFRKGQGVVSLIAAVKNMLKTELGPQGSHVSLLAAGGIVNGDGVAAVTAMGVDGVVMGTRVSSLLPGLICRVLTVQVYCFGRIELHRFQAAGNSCGKRRDRDTQVSAHYFLGSALVNLLIGPLSTISWSRVRFGDPFTMAGLS